VFPLFDAFITSVVIFAAAAACYMLSVDLSLRDDASARRPSRIAAFRERACRCAGARIAVATIIAAAFGVLEYISHRVFVSLSISPDAQAVGDGAVVAIAAAVASWTLLGADGTELHPGIAELEPDQSFSHNTGWTP
jgi:hypothetical protein